MSVHLQFSYGTQDSLGRFWRELSTHCRHIRSEHIPADVPKPFDTHKAIFPLNPSPPEMLMPTLAKTGSGWDGRSSPPLVQLA